MADTCTYCGKDLDGVYQYYWGNPCHPECSPANTAAAKEREFQRQFGRDEATRATPPAAVVEAMERALRHADQVSRDLGWHRIYDETGAALAALTAWRDEQ